MNVLKAAAIVTLASATLVAQDAITTLPDNYKLQFENAWVKVTRVHYPAHAKVPAHTHTALACAYVYLNDSGPVVFKHVGAEYGAVTRQPVKAGSFRRRCELASRRHRFGLCRGNGRLGRGASLRAQDEAAKSVTRLPATEVSTNVLDERSSHDRDERSLCRFVVNIPERQRHNKCCAAAFPVLGLDFAAQNVDEVSDDRET
jgi:hypothetical protein